MSEYSEVRMDDFFRASVWLRVAVGVIFLGYSGWMTATWAQGQDNKDKISKLEAKVEAAAKEAKQAAESSKEAAKKAEQGKEQAVRNGAKLDILLRNKGG